MTENKENKENLGVKGSDKENGKENAGRKVEPKSKPVSLELEEMKELLQRTQASFENYRKQVEKRIAEIQEQAARETLLQVLPILDNLELAFKNASSNPQGLLEGVELIHAQFKEVLENNHVLPIEAKSMRFDPRLHEALMKVESDLPENTIIEEFQKGFTLRGQVLRPAKVKLSAGKKKAGDKKEEEKKEEKINNQ